MNYDALIKRAKKVIEIAKNIAMPAAVHKVSIDDDIAELTGLVVVMHPDYLKTKESKQATPDPI